MAIRILRIIEYVYEDEQRAAEDMARWTPALRVKGLVMRSAVLPLDAVRWTEPDGDSIKFADPTQPPVSDPTALFDTDNAAFNAEGIELGGGYEPTDQTVEGRERPFHTHPYLTEQGYVGHSHAYGHLRHDHNRRHLYAAEKNES